MKDELTKNADTEQIAPPDAYTLNVTCHANRQTTQNSNDLLSSTLHTSFESE